MAAANTQLSSGSSLTTSTLIAPTVTKPLVDSVPTKSDTIRLVMPNCSIISGLDITSLTSSIRCGEITSTYLFCRQASTTLAGAVDPIAPETSTFVSITALSTHLGYCLFH